MTDDPGTYRVRFIRHTLPFPPDTRTPEQKRYDAVQMWDENQAAFGDSRECFGPRPSEPEGYVYRPLLDFDASLDMRLSVMSVKNKRRLFPYRFPNKHWKRRRMRARAYPNYDPHYVPLNPLDLLNPVDGVRLLACALGLEDT